MKNQYRIRNWSEYNAGLKHRGSITFWLSTDVIEEWLIVEKTGKRGASTTYNDIAIASRSTIKSIFSLAGRQAQGQPRMGQIVVADTSCPGFHGCKAPAPTGQTQSVVKL